VLARKLPILLKNVILGDDFDLNELKSAIDFKQQGYAKTTNVLNYLATHDREHMIVELGDKGIFGKPAFDRVKLGLVLQITTPGIPLIWMGDEFGQASHKASATSDPNPLDWSLLNHDLNKDLLEFYKRTIALRKQIPALLTDNIEFFYEDGENSILSYVRWNDEGSQAVVIANLGDRSFPEYEISHSPVTDSGRIA
jgi:1,4-alpha-glucan branching enzyme